MSDERDPLPEELEKIDEAENAEGESKLDYGNWNGVDIIQSLCMRCGANGETRLMLHKIPHFRELVIASFHCEECGERNNEVTFGGEIQLQGCIYQLKVTSPQDLNRQIIKSDSAAVRIRELDFEIPAHTQKGEINTLEGILRTAAKNLGLLQAERLATNLEVGLKVAQVISRLLQMADGELLPFHIDLDDPAGNSYLENLFAPHPDPHMKCHYYHRTREQDIQLGLEPDKGVYKDDAESNYLALLERTRAASPSQEQLAEDSAPAALPAAGTEEGDNVLLGREQAVAIPSQCPHCGMTGQSLTALTNIPHFKEVIIMAFDCKHCGFRTNEVKAGGAVPLNGTEVHLKVTSADDLKRDVLKSDSTNVLLPELELELSYGSLGGMYTTVEGLLHKIHKQLRAQNPFLLGDASALHHSQGTELSESKARFTSFLQRLERFANGEEFGFSICLRDPLGNSFISAPLHSSLPPELDSNLKLVDYSRTFEENEEFGLNDLNTRDFEVLPEDTEMGPVNLPDRLTHVHVKQADHPTAFAKGTNDNDSTMNGVFFSASSRRDSRGEGEREEEQNLPSEIEYCKPPPGWSAERPEDDLTGQEEQVVVETEPTRSEESEGTALTRRVFTDDSDLDFIPRESFSVAREGYVFRLGSKGLGYYQDRGPMVALRALL